MSLSQRWLAYACLLIAQMTIGVNIVTSKILVANCPFAAILCFRFVLASVVLYSLHVLMEKPSLAMQQLRALGKRDWSLLVCQGLCAGLLFNAFLLLGLHFTSASIAGIITSALPAIIIILSVLILKQRVTRTNVLCVTFAILGLFVINLHNLHAGNGNSLLGDLFILLALIPEAGYYVLAKVKQPQLPAFLRITLLSAVNVPFLLVWLLYSVYQGNLNLSLHDLILILANGMATALFFAFWEIGSRNIEVSVSGLFTASMPVFTLVIAWFVLNEQISALQALGMLLVIGAIFINVLGRRSPIMIKPSET